MADTMSKIPVKTERKPSMPSQIGTSLGSWGPFDSLRREIDHLFERLHEPSGRFPFSQSSRLDLSWPREAGLGIAPAVDVIEKENEFEIIAAIRSQTANGRPATSRTTTHGRT